MQVLEPTNVFYKEIIIIHETYNYLYCFYR